MTTLIKNIGIHKTIRYKNLSFWINFLNYHSATNFIKNFYILKLTFWQSNNNKSKCFFNFYFYIDLLEKKVYCKNEKIN